MSVFSEIKLGDAVTFQRGFDITKAQQTPGPVPIVSSSGVSSFHNKVKVEGPGVIIGRKGTLGTVHFLTKDYWPHDTTLWVKDFKGNVPQFIAYFLRTLRLENFDTGASNPTLNRNHIHKIKVLFPKAPDTQRKIAAVLTAYDDLIETNKLRIALLEKMAEELYREWFVRMRFPDHQNTKFVKGVPEDWPFDLGSTFFDHVKGKSYSSPEISNEEGSCFFITLKSFHRRGGYRKEGLKFYSGSYKDDQCVETGDVVMAVTDMTQDRAVVGEVARIPSLPGKKAVISLDVMRLIPKEMTTTFLYAYMRHSGFANYIKEFANGANVLHLKPDLVGKQRLLFPPRKLRKLFSDLADPIYQEAGALEDANDVLTQTRDLLLPRLISGKLSVEDLDIQFPPSMQEEATEPEPAHA